MTCTSCNLMKGGSLASDRVMSFVKDPVSNYDFVPGSAVATAATAATATPSTAPLDSVNLNNLTGGRRRSHHRSHRRSHRRSHHRSHHRGGGSTDWRMVQMSGGPVNVPQAGLMELSKNFTTGTISPVQPVNAASELLKGGSRRCSHPSRHCNKKHKHTSKCKGHSKRSHSSCHKNKKRSSHRRYSSHH